MKTKEQLRDERLSRPMEEINGILDECEASMELNLDNIRAKHNIPKQQTLNKWIRRYRPSLIGRRKRVAKQHWDNYLSSGLTQKQYAAQNNMHENTLQKIGRKYGKGTAPKPNSYKMQYTEERIIEILREYDQSLDLDASDIRKKYNVKETTWHGWTERYSDSVDVRRHSRQAADYWVEQWSKSGMSIRAFADRNNLSDCSLQKWCRRFKRKPLRNVDYTGSKEYFVYGLYKEDSNIENIEDGLYYVGITNSLSMRKSDHLSKGGNKLKKEYIENHGCKMVPIWDELTLAEAEDRELFLIHWMGQLIDETGFLTNVCNKYRNYSNVNLGRKWTDEHKKKISDTLKKKNEDPEFRKNNRDRGLGRPFEEVLKILNEYKESPEWTALGIRNKYGITKSQWSGWIGKYMPELRGKKYRIMKYHVRQWRKSRMTKSEYCKENNLPESTFSGWVTNYSKIKGRG